MKTSIDIPGDLYRRVKIRAARDGITIREFLIECIRRGLAAPDTGDITGVPPEGASRQIELDSHLWPTLRRPVTDTTIVDGDTLATIRRKLRSDESIESEY